MKQRLVTIIFAIGLAGCNLDLQDDNQEGDGVFSISGQVDGHSGAVGLSLNVDNEVSQSLTVSAGEDSFVFENAVNLDDSFSVTIQSHPDTQVCSVSSEGSGVVKTDVSSITISCAESTDACSVYDQDLESEQYTACHSWLNAHNAVRQALNNDELPNSPVPDTPVPDLQWDEKLAQVAESYAKTCPSSHNGDRTSDYQALGGTDYSYVGENLAWGFLSIEAAVQAWADEEESYQYDVTGSDSSDGGVVGHYTQIIWRNTTHLGCYFYEDNSCSSYSRNYVCNYGPGGNYSGQLAY